jgi:hypothetical protein
MYSTKGLKELDMQNLTQLLGIYAGQLRKKAEAPGTLKPLSVSPGHTINNPAVISSTNPMTNGIPASMSKATPSIGTEKLTQPSIPSISNTSWGQNALTRQSANNTGRMMFSTTGATLAPMPRSVAAKPAITQSISSNP